MFVIQMTEKDSMYHVYKPVRIDSEQRQGFVLIIIIVSFRYNRISLTLRSVSLLIIWLMFSLKLNKLWRRLPQRLNIILRNCVFYHHNHTSIFPNWNKEKWQSKVVPIKDFNLPQLTTNCEWKRNERVRGELLSIAKVVVPERKIALLNGSPCSMIRKKVSRPWPCYSCLVTVRALELARKIITGWNKSDLTLKLLESYLCGLWFFTNLYYVFEDWSWHTYM